MLAQNVHTVDTPHNFHIQSLMTPNKIHSIGFYSDSVVSISINSHDVNSLIDTGAHCNVISFNALQSCLPDGRYEISKTRDTFTVANNTVVSPLGTTTIHFKLGNKDCSARFYVMKDISSPVILGREFLRAHKACINFGDNTLEVSPSVNLTNPSKIRLRPNEICLIKAKLKKNLKKFII